MKVCQLGVDIHEHENHNISSQLWLFIANLLFQAITFIVRVLTLYRGQTITLITSAQYKVAPLFAAKTSLTSQVMKKNVWGLSGLSSMNTLGFVPTDVIRYLLKTPQIGKCRGFVISSDSLLHSSKWWSWGPLLLCWESFFS